MSDIQSRTTFDGMLDRLRREGEEHWRMDIHVTPNEEHVTQVRFISKKRGPDRPRATVILDD